MRGLSILLVAVMVVSIAGTGTAGAVESDGDFGDHCWSDAPILTEGTYTGSFQDSNDYQGANFRVYDGQGIAIEFEPTDDVRELRLMYGPDPSPTHLWNHELRGVEGGSWEISNFDSTYISFGNFEEERTLRAEFWPQDGDGYMCLDVRPESGSVDEWEMTVERLGTDVERKDLGALESDVINLENELASLAGENEELESEIAALETELAAFEDENAALKDDLDDAEAENAELKEELQRLEDRNAELEAELADVEDENAALKDDLAAFEDENAALKSELDDAEDENAALESELESVKDRNAELETKLETKRENASVTIDVSVEPADRDTFQVGGNMTVAIDAQGASPSGVTLGFAGQEYTPDDGVSTVPLESSGVQDLSIEYGDTTETVTIDVAESGTGETAGDGEIASDGNDRADDGSTSDSTPGFGFVAALVGLSGILFRSRQRNNA